MLCKKLQQLPQQTKILHLGEASTQKEAGFIKKKNTLLKVSNANCEFNISVHILRQKLDQYVGGNISNHFAQWVKITKDYFVLDILRSGLKIDFLRGQFVIIMSDTEKDTINSEIDKLLQMGIIVPTSYSKADFVSSVFTMPKADSSYPVILNLKNLNKFVTFQHCKLESFSPTSPGRFNTFSAWGDSLTLLSLIQIKPNLVW